MLLLSRIPNPELLVCGLDHGIDMVNSLHQDKPCRDSSSLPDVISRSTRAITARRPPHVHVHVEFRDGSRCTVEIESLSVSGTIRPAARLASAMAWIAANKVMLLAKWKEIVR